ncbi:interferon-induced GTP-binding protein Mx1-like isoform X2 [Eublepharis macularius]|uniref:Interferon-induced GTP-binding protein Mx1-like isoform X2 n=1 Tax=Eublepharis macularius TaxID=481883 RepID=A0AA97KVN4_EUBMA|nr:interferon-induced GTP-binding protein Mx1-like isoform X2 [Eublepharis macularius]
MSISTGKKNSLFPQKQNSSQKEASALCSQYEEKVRPCIDLIDSLRALGVERDLGLPAIAVIGDQSSGKSSVLEALSGVSLPRGSGIVTRCPLELKLKKLQHTKGWQGKIVYKDTEQELTSPSQVEDAIIRAQNAMAGKGVGISHELISLEIASPDVPDLTLIDLPGIARVAVGNQPQDIGKQIISLIKKYINKQQTINLVVVPSNVDIATTEALKMAQEVDSNGERTLGILTKPDLVDKGTETEVVDIVRNHRVFLNKGYMIVKCRGQSDINNKITLEAAIRNEREFFEDHDYFRPLLEERKATIPLLAERLTKELIEHITKSLPLLENQIKCKLERANIQLQECGPGVPETTEEQMIFFIQKIKLFNHNISNAVQGEEVFINNKEPRLFTKIRQLFNEWQTMINSNALNVKDIMKEEVWGFENKYRGKELPGFINYKTFEAIVKQQITLLKSPAIEMMKKAADLVRETFIHIASQQFNNFYQLLRAAQSNIEVLKTKQEEEAESIISTQFKLERVVYCQDAIYSEDLNNVRTKSVSFTALTAAKQCSMEQMTYHLNAYFKSSGNRLGTQIPLIIQGYILQDYAEKLQDAMLQLLQMKDQFSIFLQEKNNVANRRNALKERISRLTKARERLAKFPI